MAKKSDKVLKSLQKDVAKLQKRNDKLAQAIEDAREEQAEALREVRALIEELLTTRDEAPVEPAQENRSPDGEVKDEPEITEAAQRRARELDVDLTSVRGTGSGGRILVKDVEAAADGGSGL